MREGTPIGGRDVYIEAALINGPDRLLVAYTNPHDSLGPSTLVADLVQPTQVNGYAPILLPHTSWSRSNGIATYTHPAGPNTDQNSNPCWFPTGTWSADVTGVAIIENGGTRVLHFYDYRDGAGAPIFFTAASGKRLPVDVATIFGS